MDTLSLGIILSIRINVDRLSVFCQDIRGVGTYRGAAGAGAVVGEGSERGTAPGDLHGRRGGVKIVTVKSKKYNIFLNQVKHGLFAVSKMSHQSTG